MTTASEKAALQADRDNVQAALDSLSTKIENLVVEGTPPPPAPQTSLVAANPSAWCWIQKGSTVRYGDNTYFGVVGGIGGDRQKIVQWNHVTQERIEVDVSTPDSVEKDDHNQPTIWRRPTDGRLVCAFSPHNGQGYTRLSTNPNDASEWGPAIPIEAHSSYHPQCYPSLLDDGTHLYCLIRQHYSNKDQWKLIPLNDDGSMRGSDREAVWYAQSGAHKPYVIPVSDPANGWLHFFATRWSQNVAEDNREIWHARRSVAGHWYDSLGNQISHLDSQGGGFYHSPGWDSAKYDLWTRVVTTTAPESCWIVDATIDGSGNPVVLWQKETTGDWANGNENFEFWRSRWTGTQWQEQFICTSGSSPAAPAHRGYSGCASFDDGPNSVYVSVEVSGVHEIQRWGTVDGGVTWTKVADITSGSSSPNWRPIAVKGRVLGESPEVAWMGQGPYPDFVSFETRIVG